jgi:hypothetical protein
LPELSPVGAKSPPPPAVGRLGWIELANEIGLAELKWVGVALGLDYLKKSEISFSPAHGGWSPQRFP